MSAPVPFLPPVLETVHQIVTSKSIPELDEIVRFDVTEYLYKHARTALRIEIAEVAYRNHQQRHASDLFLSSTLAMAQGYARSKPGKLFLHPTDWHAECFYHGAVTALMNMFQRQTPVGPSPSDFRRYLLRTIANGALCAFFNRGEFRRVEMVGNIEEVPCRTLANRNPAEQQVIARQLLEQIQEYPLLQRALSKTLACIVDLGAGHALKECDPPHNDPNRRAAKRYNVSVLDCAAIAKARGVKVGTVWGHLNMARQVLRMAFNGDGSLFQSR